MTGRRRRRRRRSRTRTIPCGARPRETPAPPPLAAQVGTVLLPALVATELAEIVRDHHAAHPAGSSAARIGTWLGALVPRVMYPGGWTHAARFAGAEPLLTGRTRIYDESTLRQAANQ